MRRTIALLAGFVALSLVCTGWLAGQIGQLQGAAGVLHKTYGIRATFTDATGLVGGDDVRLAGVRVGKVGKLAVERGKAVVTLRVDNRYRLPADSTFQLRWKNLLGQRFVLVVPPTGARPGGREIAKGARIPTARTSEAADLSTLLNNTQPIIARLDTHRLNRVMTTFAAALRGRELVLGRALEDSAALVNTLNARAELIGRSVTDFATLLGGIADHDAEVRQLLESMGATASTLAGRAGDLAVATQKAGGFTSALARVLQVSDDDLDVVLGQMRQVLDRVAANREVLSKSLATLPWTTSAMIRMTSSGDWINAYVRGAGVVDAYFAEPRIGSDYNNIGPDDTKAPAPLLGSPRAPLPVIPTADAGLVAVNPKPGASKKSRGLGLLLRPLVRGANA